ncbi:CinA family protein [Herbaspirillum sp. WGmk3]|jgi:competence/damage-inducible protein CinA C-terminal domain|uniref:CinA family protein n=1 Tax=Herbaspirillum huttiense subsp. lycopersici TaxID=3074428 RepID=A0ABU2ERW9_9BURK|nr:MULTISPECIES: CinA family protein [Herbaspirillum]MBP1316648.1 nicotinamide-nucleotide amidase [Herbaspirillum sp. 1130]MCO4855572.1 CinA family protein [Herbaspirillum sp. WGmk3]MDR6739942.1 nicotinamide-nucleotide amidase [Herbaspirillum sp. 1173]MDR9850557.1 CinA family protein [Herbaspirillum huttiense SE1]
MPQIPFKETTMRAMRSSGERLGHILGKQGMHLVTVESCTAGLIAAGLGDVEGCAAWLEGAFVTYTVEAKHCMLGVTQDEIDTHGLTSEYVAERMARGGLAGCNASLAIANTGVAGPDDAPDGTKAGTVCFAWLWQRGAQQQLRTSTCFFDGDRQAVRHAAALHAINEAIRLLGNEDERRL